MKSNIKNNIKYNSPLKRFIAGSAIVVVTFFSTFTFVGTANAGIFSLFSSLLTGEQVSAKESRPIHYLNSQNMTLLAAAANRDPNPDRIMDIVPVDGGETLVADLAISNAPSTDSGNTQISTYVVREGDTISSVAKLFDVSINTILWANNLTGKSFLRAGQTLVILPISGLNYTIKKGDTLQGIAKKYNADTGEILAFNDLTISSALTVGDTIIIPDAEISAPSAPAVGPKRSGSINEPLLDGWNWPSIPGYFTRPVIGGIKTQKLHGHNGIDIAAPIGTSILASAGGTVIINRMNGAWNGGYGNYVVISHSNGTQTLYAHLSKSSVSAGDKVSKGEKIAYMGSTGMSTGSHVHFEIRGAKNPF